MREVGGQICYWNVEAFQAAEHRLKPNDLALESLVEVVRDWLAGNFVLRLRSGAQKSAALRTDVWFPRCSTAFFIADLRRLEILRLLTPERAPVRIGLEVSMRHCSEILDFSAAGMAATEEAASSIRICDEGQASRLD